MMSALASLPADIIRHRVLGPKDTAAFLGLSASQLRRMRAERILPQPIRFSERRYGWRIGQLIEWLNDGAPDEWDRNSAEMERDYQEAKQANASSELPLAVPGFGVQALSAIMRGAA